MSSLDELKSTWGGASYVESDNGGSSRQPRSFMDDLKDDLNGVLDSINEHFQQNARDTFEGMQDENGDVTPEAVAAAENGNNYNYDSAFATYDNAVDNPEAYNPDVYQPEDSFGRNLRTDVNDYGNEFMSDVSTAIDSIDNGMFDGDTKDAMWKVYEDVARPAGMVAVTPFVPGPIRAAAGLIYAPKFASDVINSVNNGGVQGAVNDLALNPLQQAYHDITNPAQLIADIKAHPANLWDRVLMPATMGEVGVRGGRKVYKNRENIKNFAQNPREFVNDYIDKGFDEALGTALNEDMGAAESAEAIPFLDTGHGDIDQMIAEAAAREGVPLDLAHAVAGRESHHGELDSNIMQVLDDTGREMGYDNMSDPQQSIDAGMKYLGEKLRENNGDVDAALRAYNGGGDPNYVEHVKEQPWYSDDARAYDGEAAEAGAESGGGDAWNVDESVVGKPMDNGPVGCVEAVTKFGAENDFLGRELANNVVGVPRLIEDAKAEGRYMDFDPNALERGDVIVYDGDAHVVMYDGHKGYYGNSTGSYKRGNGHTVHGSDYTEMDGRTPTGIIKVGRAGEGGERGVRIPPDDTTSAGDVGDLKPLDGDETAVDESGLGGFEDDVTRAVDSAADDVGMPSFEESQGPRKIDWGDDAEGAKLEQRIADGDHVSPKRLANYPELKERQESAELFDSAAKDIEADIEKDIADELERMKANPGGQGVEVSYLTDDRGQIVKRGAVSRNPEWYQKFYKKNGRPPHKDEMRDIAIDTLRDYEEFGRKEEQLEIVRKTADYVRRGYSENEAWTLAERDIHGEPVENHIVAERGRMIQGEKSGRGVKSQTKKGRTPEEERAMHDDDVNVIKADESRRGVPIGSTRGMGAQILDVLKKYVVGRDITNKKTGIVARISEKGAKKMISDRAIATSIRNGFTAEDHLKAVTGIRKLFEDSDLSSILPDKYGSKDIKNVKHFRIDRGDGSVADILVKEYTDKKVGQRIYTIELQALEKPAELKKSPGKTSSAGSGNPVNRDLRSGTASAQDSLSDSSIPQAESKGNTSEKNTSASDNPNVQAESQGERITTPAGQKTQTPPDTEGRLPEGHLGSGKPKGHYDGETVTRKQIFDRVRELFGTTRIGRQIKGALGHYDRAQDTVRNGSYGDFNNLWHEVGHRIDSYLKLADRIGHRFDSEFDAVMNRKYNGHFLDHYRADELVPEGIAEFVKEYMNDPSRVEKDFPTFYKEFQKILDEDKDLAARMQEAREMMETWRTQPEGARIAGEIVPDPPKTFREKVKDALDKFMQNWIDDKWGIHRAVSEVEKLIGRKLTMEESPYIAARMARDRGISAAEQLLRGEDAAAVTKALNKFYGGVLKHEATLPQVIEKLQELKRTGKDWLADNGLKDVQQALSTYLVARRFMEVYDLKTKNGGTYRMPESYETYKRFCDNAPQELKDAAEKLYDLHENVLAIMHHEGMLSDALFDKLTKEHRHYVSLARDFPDDASGALGFGPSNSFVNVTNMIKKLTEEGSVRDVKDPMQTIPQNILKSLLAVERNRVGQKFTDMTQFYGAGGIVEKVIGTPKTLDSTFYVWRDGKKETYQTTPEIYQSLKSMTPQGSEKLIQLMLQLPAKVMRAGAVTYNPAFLAKNLFRDQLTAYLYSNYGYKPFLDMAKGVFHLLKQDDMYQEFKSAGVTMSSILYDSQTIVPDLMKAWEKKGLRQKIFTAINPKTSLPALSEFIEQSTRIGLYARARRKGASLNEATMEAREGTLDFGRAGIEGRKANRIVPFFNAVIQDPLLFMEKFKANPARMMKRCAPMVLGSLALYAIIQSNEETAAEYNEMLPYEKNMFWNIPVPKAVSKTGWVRYPKPFGPGFLFASFPERIADFAAGKDKSGKGMKEWAKGFLESFNPYSLGTLAQAWVEWNANYSLFRERSIVPQKEQKLPNAQQYGTNTSEAAKAIGKALDLSPRKIDNLGQNLFAGSWSAANNVIDTMRGKERNNNPLSTLTVDPYRSPQSVQDFYDKLEEAEKTYNGEKNGGKPSGTATANYKMLQKANKVMSDLNKKEREAIAKGDDAAVDRINRQQLSLAKSALAQVK